MAKIEPVAYFREDFIPFKTANVSIASSPVLYGLAIYTVFGVFIGADKKHYVFRLEDHYNRLVNSAKIMGFDDFIKNWSKEKFVKTMRELIKHNNIAKDSLVRVVVFVDAVLGGTHMRGHTDSLSAFVYALDELLPMTGCKLMVSSWQRTPDSAIPPRAKITGNYANSSLIKNEALLKGYDDGIALNSKGYVSESSVANIFLVEKGKLVTPNAEADILDGITCDSLLKIAEKLGIKHERRPVKKSELYKADEAFLCGSSALVTPIASIDKRKINNGKPGKVTKTLMDEYNKVVHGQNASYKQWLVPL